MAEAKEKNSRRIPCDRVLFGGLKINQTDKSRPKLQVSRAIISGMFHPIEKTR
jgi:hypothetical protein